MGSEDLISMVEQQATPPSAAPLSTEQRRAILAQRIAEQVRKGYRVESQMEYQAILVKGHRPNHILHLILSILTAGLWLFVWLALAVFGGENRRMITVDEFGN